MAVGFIHTLMLFQKARVGIGLAGCFLLSPALFLGACSVCPVLLAMYLGRETKFKSAIILACLKQTQTM